MWVAVVLVAPKKNFAVLVTANQGGQQEACNAAVAQLAKWYRERAK